MVSPKLGPSRNLQTSHCRQRPTSPTNTEGDAERNSYCFGQDFCPLLLGITRFRPRFFWKGQLRSWSVCPGFFFGQYKVLHISHDMGTGCNGHVDCVPNQLMACRIWSNSYVQNRQQIFAKSTFGTRFCSHETVGIDVCSWRFSSTKIFLKFEQCWIHPGWLFYQAASWGRHPKGCQWTAKHKCLKRGAYLFVCLIVTMVHEIPWMYMGCLSMYIYIYL